MAEFNRLPTQEELSKMLYQMQLGGKSTQDIINENLASGSTIKALPENMFQKMAKGAGIAKEQVNKLGTAADVAKLFPGYTGQSQVNIPTGYNFAPKQDPMGGVVPSGMQTQQVNVNQLLQAIKPADVLGITGAQQAYTDVGMGKAPNPMDVLDVAGLGAVGMGAGKGLLGVAKAAKDLPVGMSIQDVSKAGLLAQAPKSDIGFYSAVEQAAINTPRKQGAGQAFLNDISKGQDVRADEIKWMGLDDYLKDKKSVTKQEVQDYIANNRVNVEEVASVTEISPGNYLEKFKKENIPALFGKYQRPGGENYRELVLTMPNKNMGALDTAQIEAGSLRKQTSDLMADWKAISEAMPGSPEAVAAYEKVDESRKLMNEAENFVNSMKKQIDENTYKSYHFPYPSQQNPLAHLRVNDRVDADGKKMLFIEEVQSDWLQAAREKGFKFKNKDEFEKEHEINFNKQNLNNKEIKKITSEMDNSFSFDNNSDAWVDDGSEKFKKLNDSLLDLKKQKRILKNEEVKLEVRNSEGVLEAPFKDTWYQLALKRAIQHAAENGYDRIGLATGIQQAKRYPNEANVKGMEKYYDEIYPKFLDKYGKKWGARVGETTIPTDRANIGGVPSMYPNQEPIRYLDITPEMKAGVSKGQPLFTAAPIAAGGGLLGAQEERK
jgi:hypothetical protein